MYRKFLREMCEKRRCLCPKDSYASTLLALCQTRCKHDLQIFYLRAFLYSVHCRLSRSMAECQHPHSCMPQTYIFCKASALICHTRLAANACVHCITVSHAFIVCRLPAATSLVLSDCDPLCDDVIANKLFSPPLVSWASLHNAECGAMHA